MIKRLLSLAVITGAVFGGTSANAAQLIETCTPPSIVALPAGGERDFSTNIMQFNSTTGTLNSIEFQLNVTGTISGNELDIHATADNDFFFGPASNPIVLSGLTVTVLGDGAVTRTVDFTETDSTVLMDFTGTGNVPVEVEVFNIEEGTLYSATFDPENVIYNYTAAVPAPLIGRGLPVLLAVGGLLFGAKLLERGRRRRLQFG